MRSSYCSPLLLCCSATACCGSLSSLYALRSVILRSTSCHTEVGSGVPWRNASQVLDSMSTCTVIIGNVPSIGCSVTKSWRCGLKAFGPLTPGSQFVECSSDVLEPLIPQGAERQAQLVFRHVRGKNVDRSPIELLGVVSAITDTLHLTVV